MPAGEQAWHQEIKMSKRNIFATKLFGFLQLKIDLCQIVRCVDGDLDDSIENLPI